MNTIPEAHHSAPPRDPPSHSPPPPACDPPSPPPHHHPSRKTLIYLILTLNHIYPDYDFSLLRAHHFQKEEGISRAEESIDSHLLEVSKVGGRLGGQAAMNDESYCALVIIGNIQVCKSR